jgi:aspartokinase
MKKISDAVLEIVAHNRLLGFGLHHRLLNLSQVARFIRPLVEARTHKEVRDSAVLMSLSRLHARLADPGTPTRLVLDDIRVHSGLCSLTVSKTSRARAELNRVFEMLREREGVITMTEGIGEITVILKDGDFETAVEMLSQAPRYVYREIASVGVEFTEEILASSGVLYQLLQQVALQNINVIEVTSTATEFNIYVRKEDARLAFDSIYRRFSER